MPFHDVTEYQFAADHRRVRVRAAHDGAGPGDLTVAGSEYAGRLETFMGATNTAVSPAVVTAGGARAVVVTATLPQPQGAPTGAATVLRTALLRFGSGPVVDLSVSAPETDPGAEAEFRRLLDTATPADAPDSVAAVARALAAGPTGRAAHPAGAIQLALTPDYAAPTAFALASSVDGAKYRLEAAPAAAGAARSAGTGTILGRGVKVGRDESGQPVRYEAATLRPRHPPRGAVAESAPTGAVRRAAAAPAAGETVVEGLVRGAPVRVSGSGGTKDRCDELIQALNAAE